MSPEQLQTALFDAWSAQSSSKWRAENPALGQCGVTALVANDLFGGEILKTMLPEGAHFYNRLGNARHDFTAGQFANSIMYDDLPSSRAEAMTDTNQQQYDALRSRLGL